MTEPSGGSSGRPRRPVAVPVIALVTLTVVGVTALLGGLDETPGTPEPLGPGAVLDQGRYTTRFLEARVATVASELSFGEDKRFVEMLFEVTNKGDETAQVGSPPAKPESASADSFAASLVRISPAFPEGAGPFTFALADGGETRQLHPGVPAKVVVRYELKDGMEPPERMTVDVGTFEYASGFNDPTLSWRLVTDEQGEKRLPEVKARVTLPVKGGEGA